MELVGEEFMGSNDLTQTVKGRRTKRQRSSSPYKMVATTSSSSSGCGNDGGGKGRGEVEFGSVFSSTTTSSDVYESTEEVDMANCLILLAQGDGPRQVEKTSITNSSSPTNRKIENFSPKKFSDFVTSTPTTNKASFYVYLCKTCNRSFPSFQALGGHRAGHKKPKLMVDEKKPSPNLPLVGGSMDYINLNDCSLNKRISPSPDLVSLQVATNCSNTYMGSSQSNNKANKVHECSICGSEFNSGQALGGHMRRHRANTANNTNQVALVGMKASPAIEISNIIHQDTIKPRNVLSVDLNLPAPEDDHYHHHLRDPKFEFESTQQQALVFSAPTLVDCHY